MDKISTKQIKHLCLFAWVVVEQRLYCLPVWLSKAKSYGCGSKLN